MGKSLRYEGLPTRMMLRSGQNASAIEGENTEVVFGDLLDLDSLHSVVKNCSWVLYFAGFSVPANSYYNPAIEFSVSLPALNNLLTAMRVNESRARIVYASSGGTVYGSCSEPANETFALRPESGYGLGKLISEETIKYYSRITNISYDIIRLTNVYGGNPGRQRSQGVIDVFLDNAAAGKKSEIWGNLDTIRNYLYVSDVGEAVLSLLKKGVDRPSAIFNVGSQIGNTLGEVLHLISVTTKGRHKYNHSRRDLAGVARSEVLCSKFQDLTGWSPKTDLKTGIELSWRLRVQD